MKKDYQLSMLSPGEIVIPNEKESTRRKNLKNENILKKQIIDDIRHGRVSNFNEGGVVTDEYTEAVNRDKQKRKEEHTKKRF